MRTIAITKKLTLVMGTIKDKEKLDKLAAGTHHVHKNRGKSSRIKAGVEGGEKNA
jgi:hypothetical protein